MPAIPAIVAGVGAIAAAKVSGDAQKKAAKIAADASAANAPGSVNIPQLQQQAQQVAAQNAFNSAMLEREFNPGVQELRADSLGAVRGGLTRSPETQAMLDRVVAQSAQPLTAQQYDSALTRQAVEAAAADLALGGQLPQDVRNLVARQAFAKAGTVAPGSGLQLGRDIVARDLGLTSLDLRNNRLRNAATLGAQEAALGQGNASLRFGADQLNQRNLFDSANFVNSLQSGEFGRALAAASLGQNIAAPASGLDPGSIVNLAVGNSNAAANSAQNQAAIAMQAGNNKAALFGQLAGIGSSYFANRTPTPTYSYTLPATTVASGAGSNVSSIPGWTPSRY